MDEGHLQTLSALVDTVVPSINRDPDPDAFFARKATDLHIQHALAFALEQMPEAQQAGFIELIEALAGQGFLRSSERSREQIMRNLALVDANAALGIGALVSLTLFLYYGLPDQNGQNPNWAALGFPGPLSPPPQQGKSITPFVPDKDTTLEADVCVVGSGAGGGVMAAELAARGLQVVVLEAGGYFDDSDFTQLELPAYQNLYWRGGPTPTADMNVSLQAGSCLGGGTVINWTNCLRTTPWVREQWEREFGLEGLAGTEFDRHLDAVWERLGVNDRCSELNRPQQRMQAGAQKLGWRFDYANRNIDERRYSFDTAGYIGFGDQSGAKQSTAKTYLKDAYDRGATIVARCFASKVLTERGRAAGVEALYAGQTNVTVKAPQVVVACGSLESPALLLRSQIGGPAVGDHLRLHPCTAMVGYYPEDLEAWQGAPHAGLVPEFENVEDGHGFLIEAAQYTTALAASAVPFTDGKVHKRLMSRFRHATSFIALLRDRGHGKVSIDGSGMAVPQYALTDELDIRNARLGIDAVARLHEAAGAIQVIAVAAGMPTWRWGDDLEPFIGTVQRFPLRVGGWTLFAAHQMGTCRIGTDPRKSVAGPWGELHDTPGVWVGDASAFPTSSGTNPMITIMALAHRNAEAVAAASPAATTLIKEPA
jgi:choline dehydrogenase-like flavoprotein